MLETENVFDEWFFNSFKRYHKLQMFGVDKPVFSMELSCNSSVCLACEKPEENGFEILNLELPNKLYQIENEHDSISTSRDLKIKCGTLTDNRLIDMKTLFGKSKTILSEEGTGKVTIYEMDPHKSDQMIPLVNIDSKVESGRLAVDCTTDTLIIWGKENACYTGCIFNIENNTKTLMISDVPNDPVCNYTPHFMSKNELVVQNSHNGSFDLYDLTSGQHVKNVNLPEADSNAKWFLNTAYTSSKEITTFNLTLISNSGTVLSYDLRNCKTPSIYQKELFSKCNNNINISFDPCNSQNYAVSGFDSNVYILEESNCNRNIMYKFKHEGHMFTEDEDLCPNTVTSSALWLPMCGRNTLLSTANDGSIQGWQYIS
ncbi:WD repeat-containing protein 73-like [Rhopalosiphum padi]|uniref:WD repeat-containing protein 73-like n=1 Tax=Rhopalosiphum padi TaxID=40932 RepID=UPI00298ECCD5|nr:WD repeat-containing protein 73-like [Rhopalosiphum padi]